MQKNDDQHHYASNSQYFHNNNDNNYLIHTEIVLVVPNSIKHLTIQSRKAAQKINSVFRYNCRYSKFIARKNTSRLIEWERLYEVFTHTYTWNWSEIQLMLFYYIHCKEDWILDIFKLLEYIIKHYCYRLQRAKSLVALTQNTIGPRV